MYRKKLWKSIVAGTLSLTMVLSPIGTGSAVLAAEMETAETKTVTVMEEATEDADIAETATGVTSDTEEADTEEATVDEVSTEGTGIETEAPEADTATGDIPLTAKYFPDENFRSCVSEFDKNGDGVLSASEIKNVERINVSWEQIASMQGIEIFTSLKYLECDANKLSSLDVSKNTKLEILWCFNNELSSLDISKNTKLWDLYCDGNKLTSLDVSKNVELVNLECENNQLSSLDVSKNTKLGELHCGGNKLTSLDVSKNTNLSRLLCVNNELSSLGISKNTKLKDLECGNNELSSLDVSKNTNLEYLYCENNQLSSLDMRANPNFKYLDCENNELSSLDISANPKLEHLDCKNNELSSLDVSKNTKLECLYCENNQLSSLDVSANPKLKYLNCKSNQLSSLDIGTNTSLMCLWCEGNQLTSLDVSKNTNLRRFECSDNCYYISKGSSQLDLSTLPGFNVSKVSNVNGGQISGTILTFNSGEKEVTYTYDCGNDYSAEFKISAAGITVTGITLNKTSASLMKGKSIQLKATITPTDATNKTVTWTTSNSKVATVSSSGKVTAKAVGTATITCTAKDGSGVKATCKITVKNPVTKIKLNKTQATLSPKETLTLKATVTPTNASNKAVTWKSSNTKVATVNSSGKVTAKKAGTVTITCTAKDGSGVKATCKITVYTNQEAFVARIYTKALGRTPEADGLKYWANEIAEGRKTPVQVAESFFFAPEFTNKNLSNAEYVKVLYRTFMGREYDQGGLDYWVGRLNRGESRKSVLESFAGCQEFKNIVKGFGL